MYGVCASDGAIGLFSGAAVHKALKVNVFSNMILSVLCWPRVIQPRYPHVLLYVLLSASMTHTHSMWTAQINHVGDEHTLGPLCCDGTGAQYVGERGGVLLHRSPVAFPSKFNYMAGLSFHLPV